MKTKQPRALVLGGAGFIGRHVARALRADGFKVFLGTRDVARHKGHPDVGSMISIKFERMFSTFDWEPLLSDVDVDVVINCVGILRERLEESYLAIHAHAPMALAEACWKKQKRLIHVSALSLREDDPSAFISSKFHGEHAIKASGADYCIVRPSLLDGDGGYGSTWLRGLAKSPVQLVPRGARGKIAAMSCLDLGVAIAKLAALPSFEHWREVELGGAHGYSYAEYLRELRTDYSARRAWQIPIPNWMASWGAHICDAFDISPFSHGHWQLLQRDNLPSPNRLEEVLGREAELISQADRIAKGAALAKQPQPVTLARGKSAT